MIGLRSPVFPGSNFSVQFDVDPHLIPDNAVKDRWMEQLKFKEPQPVPTMNVVIEELGHPPLVRQLRGKYLHRHKGNARRQHAFRDPKSLVVVKTHKLTGVYPTAVAESPISVGPDTVLDITMRYDFPTAAPESTH